MEIRVLRYFLAVAREQSISGAAELLHLSQPTLSRQLMDMEEASSFGVTAALPLQRKACFSVRGLKKSLTW